MSSRIYPDQIGKSKQTCIFVLTRGVRKNDLCGKPCKKGLNVCNSHRKIPPIIYPGRVEIPQALLPGVLNLNIKKDNINMPVQPDSESTVEKNLNETVNQLSKIDINYTIIPSSDELKNHIHNTSLHDIFLHMKTHLTPVILEELVSKLHAIRIEFTGDGAGLSGGLVSDKFVVSFLTSYVIGFNEYRIGESDCSILGHPLSLKKINGKSTIALNWSKNPEHSIQRERFENDIIILNLRTEQWWKTYPKDASPDEKFSNFFSSVIKAGIYLISRAYCKDNVYLKSNNKTDTLVGDVCLYKMMKHSIEQNMFIEFPPFTSSVRFNILSAFHTL